MSVPLPSISIPKLNLNGGISIGTIASIASINPLSIYKGSFWGDWANAFDSYQHIKIPEKKPNHWRRLRILRRDAKFKQLWRNMLEDDEGQKRYSWGNEWNVVQEEIEDFDARIVYDMVYDMKGIHFSSHEGFLAFVLKWS